MTRQNLHRPRVGVVAPTRTSAASLAQELNIARPVLISPRTAPTLKGVDLAVVLVEESCWPLSEDLHQALLPTLAHTKGYLLHAHRHDPHPRTPR